MRFTKNVEELKPKGAKNCICILVFKKVKMFILVVAWHPYIAAHISEMYGYTGPILCAIINFDVSLTWLGPVIPGYYTPSVHIILDIMFLLIITGTPHEHYVPITITKHHTFRPFLYCTFKPTGKGPNDYVPLCFITSNNLSVRRGDKNWLWVSS